MTAWPLVLLTAVLAICGVMAMAAVVARIGGRVAVVDAAWGVAFAALALASSTAVELLRPGGSVGDPGPRWLLVAMVVLWGLRLSWHLGRRVAAGDHDDPRYEQLLGGPLAEVPFRVVVVKVFLAQGVIVLVVAAPVLTVMATATRWPWLAVPGAALWLVGVVFEALADRQLARFQRTPDRPPLLTTGVWAWSRHPNYFGDTCVWWGIWLVGGATGGPLAAALSAIGPIVMTWFLVAGSGVRLAERRMRGRPGWEEYAERTSIFIPLPPRRPASAE